MQRSFPVPQNKYAALLLEKDLTNRVIGAAIDVHRALGPGLLESAYQLCLAQESKLQKMPFEEQVVLKLNYKGIELECGCRIDFIFDKRVIVELKAVDEVLPVHEA